MLQAILDGEDREKTFEAGEAAGGKLATERML
jgi:hypothetical protein